MDRVAFEAILRESLDPARPSRGGLARQGPERTPEDKALARAVAGLFGHANARPLAADPMTLAPCF
jgi:hypothetical protein